MTTWRGSHGSGAVRTVAVPNYCAKLCRDGAKGTWEDEAGCRSLSCTTIKANPSRGGGAKPRASTKQEGAGLPKGAIL